GCEGGQDGERRRRRLGGPVFAIYATTLDDAVHDVRTVGELTGATQQARIVTSSMEASIAGVAAIVAKRAPVSCFFESYYPPLTSVGPRTFIFDVLRRAGCHPVPAPAQTDYP